MTQGPKTSALFERLVVMLSDATTPVKLDRLERWARSGQKLGQLSRPELAALLAAVRTIRKALKFGGLG